MLIKFAFETTIKVYLPNLYYLYNVSKQIQENPFETQW